MPTLSLRTMRPVLLLLRVLIALNLVALALFLLILAGSFTNVVATAIAEDHPGASRETLLLSVRSVMLIGILVVPFAHILLTRLRDIVRTVEAGDPFVPSNADRLKTIAWCLLVIQLLDLAFGGLAYVVDPKFDWSFGLTGWIAVVLLFVLARVFEHGTAMRDELAGTV